MQLIIDRPNLICVDFPNLEIGVPYYCEALGGIFVRLKDDHVLIMTENDTEPFELLEGETELIDYCNQYGINPKALTFVETTNRSIYLSLVM